MGIPKPVSGQLRYLKDVVFRPKITETLCYVLMPFEEPFDRYYLAVIAPAIRQSGLEPRRADDNYRLGAAVRKVWDEIWAARLIIADVSSGNPNVNYELGLSHAIQVPTIIITQDTDKLPFDYRHHDCIRYDPQKPGWEQKLIESLADAIRNTRACLSENIDLPWPYEAMPARVASAEQLSVLRRKFLHYHLTRKDGKKLWISKILDFTTSKSPFENPRAIAHIMPDHASTPEAHLYEFEAHIFGPHIVMAISRLQDLSEPISVEVFPRWARYKHAQFGFRIGTTWDDQSVRSICVMSENSLTSGPDDGPVSESEANVLVTKWQDYINSQFPSLL